MDKVKKTVVRAALCIVLCPLILIASCAPKRVEVPVYEGADPAAVLSAKNAIREMEATFAIEFEKDGTLMRGDAVLRLTPDVLDMQVYRLGFLVGEVTSDETATRSEPPMDKNKLSILVDGIRNSFFWWSIKAPTITSEDGVYRVANSWRRLFLDRRTMMPSKQIIELDDGRQLTVLYEAPKLMEGGWFPSRLKIKLLNQALSLQIKSLSFKK